MKALIGAGAFVAIAAAGLTAAFAAANPQLLKEREDLMKQHVREWVVIRNYIQGKADQAAALAAAEALKKSVPTVPNYFPPGSEGANPDGKYGPKPEVFSEHDKFVAAAKKVEEQVDAVDAAIRSGDKPKVEAAFKELDACNACHNTFRAKLQ
ncbi:MAG TPA: cytochrome c [Stellaceae bacterium]|nr:cytochrome c [Stellaceae bacterium]